MVDPDLKPVPRPMAGGAVRQTAGDVLTVPWSTAVMIPATAVILTVPIVTGAGFLLLGGSFSGRGNANINVSLVIDVDGAPVIAVATDALNIFFGGDAAAVVRVPVAAGAHVVSLQAALGVAPPGIFTIDPVLRPLQDSASLTIIESAA